MLCDSFHHEALPPIINDYHDVEGVDGLMLT